MSSPEYLTAEYYRRGRRTEPPSWPEQDPPPEVLNTDPMADVTQPRAVKWLVEYARASGWNARAGYSRGPERAVRVGTYKLTEHWGVWAAPHPDTHYRFAAVYSRTVGAKSWTWTSIRIWKPGDATRFGYALITDLNQFVTVRGSVNLAWFKGIEARECEKADKNRAAARNRPRTKKEGSS